MRGRGVGPPVQRVRVIGPVGTLASFNGTGYYLAAVARCANVADL